MALSRNDVAKNYVYCGSGSRCADFGIESLLWFDDR